MKVEGEDGADAEDEPGELEAAAEVTPLEKIAGVYVVSSLCQRPKPSTRSESVTDNRVYITRPMRFWEKTLPARPRQQ